MKMKAHDTAKDIKPTVAVFVYGSEAVRKVAGAGNRSNCLKNFLIKSHIFLINSIFKFKFLNFAIMKILATNFFQNCLANIDISLFFNKSTLTFIFYMI